MSSTDDSSETQDEGTSETASKLSGVKEWLASYEDLPELLWPRNFGLLHLALGILAVIVGSVVGAAFGGSLTSIEVIQDYESEQDGPGVVQALSLLSFQGSMFFWPFIVTKVWKGRGAAKDWGLSLRLADVSTGVVAAVVALLVVPLTAGLVSALVGLENPTEAGNTSFLTEAKGSPWLVLLIFGAVVGAPLAEEVFFRGFVQRSLQRFGGKTVGVLGSTVLFALPHFTGAALKPTIVLLAAISTIGLLFGIIFAVTNRLGPTIIAHILFNGFVVGSTLLF